MKFIYILIGFIALGLGTIGIFLPILPTFPFLLMSAFCFSKSSSRCHKWLLSTKMYQDMVIPLKKDKAMSFQNKVKIMVMVTILMSIGFICMKQILIGRIVLVFVWLFHIYYFLIHIQTKRI
ncbi:MAG: YbaN family protein [Traorella sp.]